MNLWRRWLSTDSAPLTRPLVPIRGDEDSNTFIRFYALPGSETAVEFMDGLDGFVRHYIDGAALSDDNPLNTPIALQVVPVAPELQSKASHRSQDFKRLVTSLTGAEYASDADLAELGYFIADHGGWSPLVEYLEWMYSRENSDRISYAKLYDRIDGLEPDTDTHLLTENRATDDALGTGLNTASARLVLERGYYAERARTGTREWIRNLPPEDVIPLDEAVVFINRECLRTPSDEGMERMIRATREMFNDDDEASRQRHVEELVQDE